MVCWDELPVSPERRVRGDSVRGGCFGSLYDGRVLPVRTDWMEGCDVCVVGVTRRWGTEAGEDVTRSGPEGGVNGGGGGENLGPESSSWRVAPR